MKKNLLQSLSMKKYERLLPRIFPAAVRIEIRDERGTQLWQVAADRGTATDADVATDNNPVAAWAKFGPGIERRKLPDGRMQFRAALQSREFGRIAWLITEFEAKFSVPMSTAPDSLRRAFGDATAFIQEELELQSECNQLAVELTERYEELNLVYSTKDQVEFFEEGQEALARLVHNCADYLNVGLAALICRERNIVLHNMTHKDASTDVDVLLELLGASIYDRVESQVSSIVLNEEDDAERQRIFGGRNENVLANPIIDDHGTPIGLLAVVAPREMHTFSNGDRNLLEVMAKKASRIIHTHHDSLTGLMNRSGFETSLITGLASARSKNLQHTLLHINIDQLQVVNDLMGHQEGDKLIRRIAKLMRSLLRDSDFIGRLGGDEFGVLLTNCELNQGHAIADKIRNAIHELTVVSARRQLDVSASIGIAGIGPETDGIVGAMAAAEIACKAAKDSGRDRIEVFAEDNTTLVRRSEEVEWLGRVHQALREDQFVLHCQPVMPLLDKNQPLHFEFLVRMLGDNGEVHSPALFLPAAERYQLMPMLDRWVIRRALRSIRACWQSIAPKEAVFCINLSGQSLTNTGFLAFVADEIAAAGVPARQICFEITETAAIANIDEATSFMGSLQALGCRFALDDFGAGLSSFGYLKMLPVDYLKIDGSFVREITTDEISRSMVDAICQIGRTMGLTMIAEFVGDDATVEALRKIGVDYVQGFHVGKPVPFNEISDRLQSDTAAESA